MKYQKKDPEEVRKVRMQAIARMNAARAQKKLEQADLPREESPSQIRTPRERGITTIQVNTQDAQALSEMAEAKGVSRRTFIHGIVEALKPAH